MPHLCHCPTYISVHTIIFTYIAFQLFLILSQCPSVASKHTHRLRRISDRCRSLIANIFICKTPMKTVGHYITVYVCIYIISIFSIDQYKFLNFIWRLITSHIFTLIWSSTRYVIILQRSVFSLYSLKRVITCSLSSSRIIKVYCNPDKSSFLYVKYSLTFRTNSPSRSLLNKHL